MRKLTGVILAGALALAAIACGRHSAEASPAPEDETGVAHLIIRFHVSEDRLADFLPIMTGINEAMASEEGFIEASVYRGADEPLTFTLIEKWETRALHEAHYDRIVASGDWDNILSMLAATPEMNYNEKL